MRRQNKDFFFLKEEVKKMRLKDEKKNEKKKNLIAPSAFLSDCTFGISGK
jgi:hypothetical protein